MKKSKTEINNEFVTKYFNKEFKDTRNGLTVKLVSCSKTRIQVTLKRISFPTGVPSWRYPSFFGSYTCDVIRDIAVGNYRPKNMKVKLFRKNN